MNLDIVVLIPGMPFDADTLKTKSLGGSETAGIYMAQALARHGHHVTIFCNPPAQTYKAQDEFGVRYMPASMWADYVTNTAHDVSIVQRAPEQFTVRPNSRLNVVWCHDLAMGRNSSGFKAAMWNIDKVIVLSKYMLDQYKKVLGFPEGVFMLSRNGVDLKAFAANDDQRDMNKLMYCARPERGLDFLLERIMPELLKRNPDYKLHIATYDNSVQEMAPFYTKINRLAAAMGDSVVNLGALTKDELYRHYENAGCYVYPTPSAFMPNFAEVSCITAMECQAAGLPIVTSDIGALPETIYGSAGWFIDGSPVDSPNEYAMSFCAAVEQITTNPDLHASMSAAGRRSAQYLDWDRVAEEWADEFLVAIDERNNSPERLTRHFIRNSDIIAAYETLDRWLPILPGEEQRRLQLLDVLDKDYGFVSEPDGFRKQYERIGATHDPQVIDWSPREPRFHQLKAWLSARPEIGTVLDYGCAHGGYATNLAAQLPGVTIHGVDIDHNSVTMAYSFAEKLGVQDSTAFFTGSYADLSGLPDMQYDCALAQEVLEHVATPWDVMDSIEEHVKDGGKVYITVPYGPWEYSSYYTYPWRCHIWHFDMHDLRDMFGGKKDFEVNALPAGCSQELDTPMGWWIVSYTKSDVKTGRIDMTRKLKLQAPRYTVSASLMAGPNSEEQLHWVLRPLRDIADEIVVVDCGMSAEALRIAKQYSHVKLIPGVDPKIHGFEAPRNIGLDACSCDFVLWIDTDERLVNGAALQKYLRESHFSGFGIRQHHFAVDTTFTPDMPVRLFRNRMVGDKKMRFYGMIHEHPELELNQGPGNVIVLGDVHIAHTGYLIEGVRQGRFARNYPLLKADMEKYPDRLLQKHFIMRDNMQLCRFELSQNGGQVTEGVAQKCRETVELYRKHFLGKGVYMGTDSLQYYSEALQVLGEGVDVSFNISADKVAAQPKPAQNYRFANKADLLAELEIRASQAVDQFESEHY